MSNKDDGPRLCPSPKCDECLAFFEAMSTIAVHFNDGTRLVVPAAKVDEAREQRRKENERVRTSQA